MRLRKSTELQASFVMLLKNLVSSGTACTKVLFLNGLTEGRLSQGPMEICSQTQLTLAVSDQIDSNNWEDFVGCEQSQGRKTKTKWEYLRRTQVAWLLPRSSQIGRLSHTHSPTTTSLSLRKTVLLIDLRSKIDHSLYPSTKTTKNPTPQNSHSRGNNEPPSPSLGYNHAFWNGVRFFLPIEDENGKSLGLPP